MLNLNQLRVLAAVARHGSVTGAAKELCRSDGAVIGLRIAGSDAVLLRSWTEPWYDALVATRILPGKTVRLTLLSARGMAAGKYSVAATFEQGGKSFKYTKSIRVRR